MSGIFQQIVLEECVRLLSTSVYLVRYAAKEHKVEIGTEVCGVRVDDSVLGLDLHYENSSARGTRVAPGVATFKIDRTQRDHAGMFPLDGAVFEAERVKVEPEFRRLRMYRWIGGEGGGKRLLAEFVHRQAVERWDSRAPDRVSTTFRTEILSKLYGAAIKDIDVSSDEVVIRLEDGRTLRIGHSERRAKPILTAVATDGDDNIAAAGAIVDG